MPKILISKAIVMRLIASIRLRIGILLRGAKMIAAAGLVFSPAWGQSDNIDTLSRFGSTGTPSRAFKAVEQGA
jgi:hypothetical protein